MNYREHVDVGLGWLVDLAYLGFGVWRLEFLGLILGLVGGLWSLLRLLWIFLEFFAFFEFHWYFYKLILIH
jgi:hypothetical protein